MNENAVWDTELGQLLSKGAAYLAAANGIDGSAFGPWVHDEVPPDMTASLPNLRRVGVGLFQQAAKILPNKPWIWYVIGWNLFAHEDGPRERLAARDALEHVLTLQPDHTLAHLALAWLLFQEVEHVGRDTPDLLKAAWEGPIGQHLRAGLDLRRLFHDRYPDFPDFIGADGDHHEVSWQYARGGTAPITLALDALAEMVPDEYRFAYYVAYGLLQDKSEDAIQWWEEALSWPSDDNLSLFVIRFRLARWHHIVKRLSADTIRGYQHAVEACDCLHRLDESDLSEWGTWGFTRDEFDYWLRNAPSFGNWASRGIPVFLEFVDAILGLIPDWFDPCESDLIYLGELVNCAGGLLLESNDARRAMQYFERVRAFEDQLLEEGSYDAKDWDDIGDSKSWRVVTARALRDIHIADQNYEEAQAENGRILELCSMDWNALQHRSLLDALVANRQDEIVGGLIQLLVASDGRTELAGKLEEIQATQKLLVAEVSLQRASVERLAQLREETEAVTQKRQLRTGEIDDLVGQLNDIVQQGYQIQPAAWKRARERIDTELGQDIFGQLLPDSQHYVATAEAIFWATQAFADRMDAALIAVEYAKAIETEIRGRFLPALVRFLDAEDYRGSLSIHNNHNIRRRAPNTSWKSILEPSPRPWPMGGIIDLMNKALQGQQNKKVGEFMEQVDSRPLWLRKLVNEFNKVFESYRNGAAHTKPMDRQLLQEFRNLLFDEKLLRRIVEFGQRAQSVADSRPYRR